MTAIDDSRSDEACSTAAMTNAGMESGLISPASASPALFLRAKPARCAPSSAAACVRHVNAFLVTIYWFCRKDGGSTLREESPGMVSDARAPPD